MRLKAWLIGVMAAAALAVPPVCAQDPQANPFSVPPAIRMPTAEEAVAAMQAAQAGSAAYALGEIAEAEPLLRSALIIMESTFGPDHPVTLEVAQTLAGNLAISGELDAALALLARTQAGFEAFYGPDHSLTADARRTMAFVLSQGPDPGAAQEVLADLLEAEMARPGHRAIDSLDTMIQIAQVLSFNAQYAEAEGWLDLALVTAQDAQVEDPEIFAAIHGRLGEVYAGQDRLGEAVVALRRALALRETYAVVGSDVLIGLDYRWSLGEVLDRLGKPEEAGAVYRDIASRLTERAGSERGRRRELGAYREVFRSVVRTAWEARPGA